MDSGAEAEPGSRDRAAAPTAALTARPEAGFHFGICMETCGDGVTGLFTDSDFLLVT